MSARVLRRISLGKASILVFIIVVALTALFMVKMSQGEAAGPAKGIGAAGAPHYFGPWPNWALSPLTVGDATVTIEPPTTPGGATATAVASVSSIAPNGAGAVTGITITDPGAGYTTAPNVAITSSNPAAAGAAATASITLTSAVTSVTVTAPGGGYTRPGVTFTGGGGATQATGTPYGGVTQVHVSVPGDGYTNPTVDFDMPDAPDGVQATAHAVVDGAGAITDVVVDTAGSGYSYAPTVVIRDGTIMDPIQHLGVEAVATATIDVQSVFLDTFGSGYASAPTVTIDETAVGGVGIGATATAKVAAGTVTDIAVTAAGSGYITAGGIEKFTDDLPGLCNPDPAATAGDPIPACPADGTGKYIPIGAPTQKNYPDPSNNNRPIKADVYDIGLVQYSTNFSSSLPDTLARGYVQIQTAEWEAAHPGHGAGYPLYNEMRDGTLVAVMEGGVQLRGVTPPQWLGPTIAATKNKPVRITFHNLLPTGVEGDLFLPVDSTLMGAGDGPVAMTPPVNNGTVDDEVRNPVCTDLPEDPDCFKQNRATLHLHGGITPWISDGTPHQWITPANEDTPWPQGVSVKDVPDMSPMDVPDDGISTFYYTNQQSARLLFYHDHSWGITRLGVYVGGAAGFLISDAKEQSLITSGIIPGPRDTLPLIVQERTFVPQDTQLYDTTDPVTGEILTYGQDPTWDKTKWGDYGDFWYHHVYMPAQNPGDPSGMSAYGRWMYGPWFWPPATGTQYGPIANPYFVASCDLNDPATWTYQTDPFCEPAEIPGTPNISAGMEQFNDTAIVNGVAFPKVTLEPKTYRFRVLNAANDRFLNLQWYLVDPSTGTASEVALDPLLLAQAQTDPNVFPTPVGANNSSYGPDWIQIGSEGGFLPAPTVVDGQQPTTWITDPTRFDVGNVDKHSLLLGPAERADVIVDFSAFEGQTLIMYNDAPAAFPARVPSYDYYTGAPDMAPNGAPPIIPGFGPNTRTVMKVTIAGTAAAPFNLSALRNAFSHKANGSGVFESSQNPIIVGQAAYNSAYGTAFAAASNCNAPNSTLNICDGLVRVNDTMTFGFNTLRDIAKKPVTKTTMPLQPKAIHDEMNSSTFDEFGRMQSNLGLEAQPPSPATQNVTLYPYINPATELLDGTNMPREMITYDANGNPVSDVKIQPMSSTNDGSQIWRVTHNGVDTHPIHFHLYDVQVLNRVSWDNIITMTDPAELGWKDTVRMAPLQDTIVALRPIIPELPWELPNSIHDLSPMMPTGATKGFQNIDPQGIPTAPIVNQLVNFGWEYVWHCHILSHEEMDMMRPQNLAMPPNKATGLAFTVPGGKIDLAFSDNSINETSFLIQRTADGVTWTDQGTIVQPLDQPNIHEIRNFVDPATYNPALVYGFKVVARNTVGYDSQFPEMTAFSTSDVMYTGTAPLAPSNLTATAQSGPKVVLQFLDNAVNEAGFTVERAVNGGAWTVLTTLPARAGTGNVTYTDNTVTVGNAYDYRVRADRGAVWSAWSNTASATISVPTSINVTAPGTGGTYQRNSTLAVAWTPNRATVIGEFGLWIRNADGSSWLLDKTVAANGSASYTNSVTLAVPTGTDYRISITWRATVGSGTWTVYGYSAAPGFAVVSPTLTSINVTQPGTGGSYARNSTLNVGWTPNAAVNVGEFGIWIRSSAASWYFQKTVAATGLSAYTDSITLNVPAGTDYRVSISYRATIGAGAWTIYGYSASPGFAVTSSVTSISVTAPSAGSTYTRPFNLPVVFRPNVANTAGEFGLWIRSSGGTNWYFIKTVTPTGAAQYNDIIPLTSAIPAGTGYRVSVSWRATPGLGAWTVYGYSAAPGFTIN